MQLTKRNKTYVVSLCKSNNAEKYEGSIVATFDTYNEAYERARATLREGQHRARRVIFLQIYQEEGSGKRLIKEYSIPREKRKSRY